MNFYGDAAPPRITSVGEIEPFDPILRENMYPEKTAAKVYFDAFSPQPQSDRERQSDDPARAIGVDR